MDEAFLREVDAICEEHERSSARKDKEAGEAPPSIPSEPESGVVFFFFAALSFHSKLGFRDLRAHLWI